jgi:hypothetical protein
MKGSNPNGCPGNDPRGFPRIDLDGWDIGPVEAFLWLFLPHVRK